MVQKALDRHFDEDEERQHRWVQTGIAKTGVEKKIHIRKGFFGGCMHNSFRLHSRSQAAISLNSRRIALHILFTEFTHDVILTHLHLLHPGLWGASCGEVTHLDRIFLQLFRTLYWILFVLHLGDDSSADCRINLFRTYRRILSRRNSLCQLNCPDRLAALQARFPQLRHHIQQLSGFDHLCHLHRHAQSPRLSINLTDLGVYSDELALPHGNFRIHQALLCQH